MDGLNGCFVLYDSASRITTPYDAENHHGVDMGWQPPLNTNPHNDIYSAGRGVVVEVVDGLDNDPSSAGTVASWGNYVKIRHTNGLYSRYAHIEKGTIHVSVGDEVYASTIIGRIGNSGYSFGAHLHFEVSTTSSSATRIDPTPYLTNYITPGEPLYPDTPTITSKKKFPWFIYWRKRNFRL